VKLNEIDQAKNLRQMTFKHILNFPVEAGEVEPAAHVHLVRHISESGFSWAKMGD